jgi:DNA mismatch endonuclease (patch repair protein)
MADMFTPERRSDLMRRIGPRNSAPEMAVRRLVHSLGARFRLHRSELPGKPDLVLPARRVAIFVHGCFWHGHGCRRGSRTRRPKSNTDYWNRKLDRNVARDKRNLRRIRALGWKAVVLWECETADLARLERKLRRVLAIPSRP